MTQKPISSTFMRLFNSSTFIALVMLFGSVAGYGQNPCGTTSEINLTATNANTTVCKNSIQSLSVDASNFTDFVVLKEDFNINNNEWIKINESTGGTRANSEWKIYNDNYYYSQLYYGNSGNFHSNDNSNFIMSHSWAQGILSTTTNTSLISPAFSLVGLTSAKLNFYHFYRDNNNDNAKIEISLDNGANWTTLETYNSNQGAVNKFTLETIDLNTYLGNASVKIKFKYNATWDYYWAIDNFSITGSSTKKITWSPTTNLYTDAACTTPYNANTHSLNVWAKPSATTTYTATATNGACSKTAEVIFKIETAAWDGSAWSTQPNATTSLVFAGDYNSNTDNISLIEGCDCTVTSGAVTIASDHVLKLKNELNVNGGSMTFENNATLLQINNVINTGNITYKRTAVNIKGPDFVYWSSPVIGQTIGTIYSGQGPKYSWDTLANNGNGANGNISQGTWTNTPATMTSGIGYIIRGSSSFGMGPTAINSVFTGVPANGLIQATVKRGAYTGADYLGANGATISNLNDNLNLLGNPYPSAIDAVKFLEDNKDFIEGNVKLWMHGSAPSSGVENPFYGSFTYNYSASDYVTINATGSTDKNVKPIIRAGQGFFVTMKDGPADDAKVSFQNTQRNDNGNAYANNEFFRTTTETVERNRIWLDLVNANNIAETTLLGYVTGATEAKESAYDALASELPMGIYSILADEKFVIQGRSLPFDTNDQVAIGYNVATAGTYKLALNFVDGLFADAAQNIYIEDTTTGIIHDLKASPYSFTTAAGTFKTRFVLRYTYETLGMEDFTANEVKVYANESINVSTAHQSLQTVKVYDLQGRVLGAYKNINATTFSTYAIAKTQTALIVEVVLANGATQSYKVIY